MVPTAQRLITLSGSLLDFADGFDFACAYTRLYTQVLSRPGAAITGWPVSTTVFSTLTTTQQQQAEIWPRSGSSRLLQTQTRNITTGLWASTTQTVLQLLVAIPRVARGKLMHSSAAAGSCWGMLEIAKLQDLASTAPLVVLGMMQ